jgi:CRISPR/Cas system CSM-associated protein Csm2 small subunit
MTKASVWSLCGAMLVGSLFAYVPSAQAIPPFYKEFEAVYVKKDGNDQEKAYAELITKIKCNVCHVKGQKKTEKNEYGKALDELLDKKMDEKNVEKIREALKTVEAKKMDPANENSPTFGEQITQGKTPAGNTE